LISLKTGWMKLTLDDIKDKLRNRLIEHDGNIEPHHLVDIVEEVRAIGLSERDISKLVPELDQSINWTAIREEKRIEQETIRLKEQEGLKAAELINALINFCFSDGVIESHELAAIFTKAEELQQNVSEITKKINEKIDQDGYKPFPNADLNAGDLKDVLLSTSWYDAKKYAAVKRRKTQAKTVSESVAPVIAVPRIHLFEASKHVITKGESITLSWEVSGIDQLTISGLGPTNTLKGSHSVTPEIDTIYVLDAGGLTRTLNVVIKKTRGWAKWFMAAIVPVLFLLYVGYKSCAGTTVSGNNTSHTITSPLTGTEKERITIALQGFYKENNGDGSTGNIQKLTGYFADPVSKYYNDAGVSRAKMYKLIDSYFNKKLSAHRSDINKFSFLRRTPENGYMIRANGTYYYKLKNAKHTRTGPINDIIILNDHYEITAVYKE